MKLLHPIELILYTAAFGYMYAFSIWGFGFYTGGDQEYYTEFFDALEYASITEVPVLQLGHTGSAEPIYGLLMWVGSEYFAKSTLISLFNSILAVQLTVLLKKYKVHPSLWGLYFSNYYLLVLLFAAERLKIAMIIFLMFFLVKNRARYAFLFLSPLAHLQTPILIASIYTAAAIRAALRFFGVGKLSKKKLAVAMLLSIVILFVFVWLNESILSKLGVYSGFSVQESAKVILFLGVALILVKEKINTLFAFLPIILAAMVFSDERVNMMGFLVFSAVILHEGRTFSLPNLAILLYFSIRGFVFVSTFVESNDGFI